MHSDLKITLRIATFFALQIPFNLREKHIQATPQFRELRNDPPPSMRTVIPVEKSFSIHCRPDLSI
jgi:hypothetical protein